MIIEYSRGIYLSQEGRAAPLSSPLLSTGDFPLRPLHPRKLKPTFREAAPGLIICLICGTIRSRIPPGGRGSRLPGRRETVMGSHRLRRSTVLKEKMLLSIGSQAETRSSIRDDARDCRYTDPAL